MLSARPQANNKLTAMHYLSIAAVAEAFSQAQAEGQGQAFAQALVSAQASAARQVGRLCCACGSISAQQLDPKRTLLYWASFCDICYMLYAQFLLQTAQLVDGVPEEQTQRPFCRGIS